MNKVSRPPHLLPTRKPASFWFSAVFSCFCSSSRSMSDPIRELEKYGRKKAKTGKLEDGPASSHSPWYLFDAFGHNPDVGIEHFAANVREEKAAAGEEAAVELDPSMIFGSGIMMMILNKLDARSVARCRLVSREWLKVASSDIIWAPKEAPNYWRNLDPYWRGTGTQMRRYFHPDGSITADPDDPVWGGHESCYTVVTGLHDDGRIREHYVRINRWPQMSVRRKEDWRWELSNNLHCYTSVPDADKQHGTVPFFPLI